MKPKALSTSPYTERITHTITNGDFRSTSGQTYGKKFRTFLFHQKLRIQISGGVLADSFLIRWSCKKLSAKEPRGKKFPKSDATVKTP